jgi:Helix-turn-helix domain
VASTLYGLRAMRIPDDLALKDPNLKDQYFDLKGLSRYCALSVSSLRNYIREDLLPVFMVHGKILVRRSEFDQWLERYRFGKAQDLNAIAEEVLGEIGLQDLRSQRIRG